MSERIYKEVIIKDRTTLQTRRHAATKKKAVTAGQVMCHTIDQQDHVLAAQCSAWRE